MCNDNRYVCSPVPGKLQIRSVAMVMPGTYKTTFNKQRVGVSSICIDGHTHYADRRTHTYMANIWFSCVWTVRLPSSDVLREYPRGISTHIHTHTPPDRHTYTHTHPHITVDARVPHEQVVIIPAREGSQRRGETQHSYTLASSRSERRLTPTTRRSDNVRVRMRDCTTCNNPMVGK